MRALYSLAVAAHKRNTQKNNYFKLFSFYFLLALLLASRPAISFFSFYYRAFASFGRLWPLCVCLRRPGAPYWGQNWWSAVASGRRIHGDGPRQRVGPAAQRPILIHGRRPALARALRALSIELMALKYKPLISNIETISEQTRACV
jgi:hypothetical protein